MVNMVKCIYSLGKHAARRHNNEDDDHDNNSQSSLNRSNMSDFYRSAQR